jgi:hypothetical protein
MPLYELGAYGEGIARLMADHRLAQTGRTDAAMADEAWAHRARLA